MKLSQEEKDEKSLQAFVRIIKTKMLRCNIITVSYL